MGKYNFFAVIPVAPRFYIIYGPPETGKTLFLNSVVNHEEWEVIDDYVRYRMKGFIRVGKNTIVCVNNPKMVGVVIADYQEALKGK